MPQPILYEFRTSARATARPLFLRGAVLTCLGITFGALFWWTVVVPVLMFFPLLLGLATLYDAGIRLLAGGEWHIRYDGEQLIWHAPAFAEDSFSARNNEISKIVAETRVTHKKRTQVKDRIRYTLLTCAGDTHSLSNQSGVDVTALVGLMREQGVPVEEVLSD